MGRCLVTGAAGFIGSHLCDRLIAEGHEVVGIDSFTDYYERASKERNLSGLRRVAKFTLVEKDILDADLGKILRGVDLVFHKAAQPGVRASWGEQFQAYVRDNIEATQRLLEACRGMELRRLVCASSSSIYGDSEDLPLSEKSAPRPISPYGATKLASEALAWLYYRNSRVPVVSLRYFTVYGPRQRPDMAFSRFIRAHLSREAVTVHGDGTQSRDFTFIDDAIDANLLAAEKGKEGEA
ncbi:MAG: NAD-dependent epimerase/dehydratase family protein, partial [Vicinamibacteria bacterium]